MSSWKRGILLTRFHSDHIGDLGEFNLQTWAGCGLKLGIDLGFFA